MARMIPPRCSDNVKSPGERELFQRLRDDPLTRDWVVLHQFEVATHRSAISGELDFFIIVPEMGVLALEVKAHRRVKRDEEGRWYLGADSTGNDISPFTQVSESMHSLREYVQHRSTKFNSVPFFSAVIFTHCNFERQSPEWRRWQLISSRRYRTRGIGRVVHEVLEKEREHYRTLESCRWFKDQKSPDKKQTEELLMVLRPPVEISQSPEEQLSLYENDVIRYTEEQFRALELAEFNPRVLYTGPAGTGKTVLAIEAARRSAAANRKVLWLCFNRALSDQIKKILKPLSSHVDVINFHSFLMRLSPGVTVEDTQEFWHESLPLTAVDRLLDGALEGAEYDQIIMDEAQDIVSHDVWLDVLDLVVTGGLSAGNLELFGDFRGQAIFADEPKSSFLGKVRERIPDIAVYPLSVNCRNPHEVVEQSQMLGQFGELYSLVMREREEGWDPRISYYRNRDDQADKLALELQGLLDAGYPPNSITVLSPKARSSASELALEKGFPALKPEKEKATGDVGYTTIHSFKGLENSFVMVTDIEDIESLESRKLLYTATTRAKVNLYLFLDRKAMPQVQRLLAGDGDG